MSRNVIIVVVIFGIASQLLGLRMIRQLGSQLTTPLRIALWIKRISMLSVLLSGVLALVLPQIEIVFTVVIVCLCVWIASTLSYWIVRLTISRRSMPKFFS